VAFAEVAEKPDASSSLSRIVADRLYLARATPSPQTVNDLAVTMVCSFMKLS
jgi:hypothetical protein